MTIPVPSGISSRRGLHRVVVDVPGLRIVRDELGAGQTLAPEADLSAELGVSRTVVREAITVLAAKGLVESRPRVGARALGRARWSPIDPDMLAWQVQAGPDAAFFADLVEVRDFIEPRAAEIVAHRATAEECDALVRLQDELEAAGTDSPASVRIDLAVHAAILGATHNGLLAQMTGAIITALGAGPVSSMRVSGSPERMNRAHRPVVEAIGRADPAGARESMEAFIASTARGAGSVVEGRPAIGRNT
jgi:GntR family transcriptional regulator, galactonate operon transcriptional repressor